MNKTWLRLLLIGSMMLSCAALTACDPGSATRAPGNHAGNGNGNGGGHDTDRGAGDSQDDQDEQDGHDQGTTQGTATVTASVPLAHCSVPQQLVCYEFPASLASNQWGPTVKQMCVNSEGQLDTGGCPQENHVATCIYPSPIPNLPNGAIKGRFYKNATIEDVRQGCAAADGKLQMRY